MNRGKRKKKKLCKKRYNLKSFLRMCKNECAKHKHLWMKNDIRTFFVSLFPRQSLLMLDLLHDVTAWEFHLNLPSACSGKGLYGRGCFDDQSVGLTKASFSWNFSPYNETSVFVDFSYHQFFPMKYSSQFLLVALDLLGLPMWPCC